MSHPPASLTENPPNVEASIRPQVNSFHVSGLSMLVAAAGIPLSLLWDFSWESTVGIDLFWSPPHTMTYVSVALVGITGVWLILRTSLTSNGRAGGVRLAGLYAPVGAWIVVWGALAFVAATLFDRWWQSAYGLGAGIWHPPQISKTVAFFALLIGAWLLCVTRQNQSGAENGSAALAFAICGGFVMAMISIVTLVSIYPNRQHSAWLYKVACATYPSVFLALTTAGRLRFSATAGSAAYMFLICVMVWFLPAFPATPQTGPIYNRLDHLMPPPFPLLLVIPALASDWLIRNCYWRENGFRPWMQAIVVGLAIAILLIGTQWIFAEFLLTDMANNRFFAGGGQHWPFFLKIAPQAKQIFWHTGKDEMDWFSAVMAVGMAIGAARVGLWIGTWMQQVRR